MPLWGMLLIGITADYGFNVLSRYWCVARHTGDEVTLVLVKSAPESPIRGRVLSVSLNEATLRVTTRREDGTTAERDVKVSLRSVDAVFYV